MTISQQNSSFVFPVAEIRSVYVTSVDQENVAKLTLTTCSDWQIPIAIEI